MWFFFSLLSAVFMTLYFILARVLLKDKGHAATFTFIMILQGAFVLLLLTPFEKIQYELTPLIVVQFLFIALFFCVVDLVFIKGRQLEEVSVVSLFNQTGIIWALIGGIVLFNEVFTIQKMLGVACILLGNIFVVWNGKKIHLSKGVKYILLGSLLFAIGSFIDKYFVQFFSPLLYKGVLFLLEAILLYIFFLSNRVHMIRKEIAIQGKGLFFIGPVFALAIFFLNKAFQVGGEASKVVPIFNLSLLFASIIGIYVLNEKENKIRKFIALGIVIVGTYLLQTT